MVDSDIKKLGFTMAEVLITLGIIGIVAAMTIPQVINGYKEREYIAKLKKFYTIINQTMMMAVEDNGEIENWGLEQAGNSADPSEEQIEKNKITRERFFDIITPYLKVLYRCNDREKECPTYARKSLDGTEFNKFTERLVLADGTTIVGLTVLSPTCELEYGTSKALKNVCGEFMIDLNGSKPPNKTGEDVFLFYYTKYGVIPCGMSEITKSNRTFESMCNKSVSDKINGYACTAWVIFNENMDYLHCTDLSWSGKKKCK